MDAERKYLVVFICILKSCSGSYDGTPFAVTGLPNSSILYSTEDAVTGISSQSVNDNSQGDDKIALYLGAYFPFGGGWDGSGIIAAVDMALHHINGRVDILKDYELRMIYNDTQCQAGLATRVLFDQLFKEPTKLMLFGGGCSTATQAIAGTSYHWNLVTMSYAASSPALSNRDSYPYFYRVVMPDTGFNPARIELMKLFGWTRVATLHQNHEIFSLAIDNLLTLLKEANITLITSESFVDDPTNQVENIKIQDAKIIVINMYENMGRKVFCEAYKKGMIGEGYAWLIVGWFSVGWYLQEDNTIDCSVEEMKAAVESAFYIGVESPHIGTSTTPTISGLTVEEFENELRARLELPEYQHFVWHNRNPYGYDAVWAVALMLNQSIEMLKTKTFADNRTRRLEDFTYDDSEMALMFLDLLKLIRFDGISGSVGFVDGDRIDKVRIEQLVPSCEDGWYRYDSGHCCFSFHADPIAYQQAIDQCEQSGGVLASITSEDEYQFIIDTWNELDMEDTLLWYIGLIWDGYSFTWVDQEVDQTSWFPTRHKRNTPISDQTFCVAVDFANNAQSWLAVNCTGYLPYICKKPEVFLEQQIGLYNPNSNGGEIAWYENITWPGGRVPLDHTPDVVITVVRIHEGIDWYLYAAMCFLASIGILLALFFLLFNLYYRNQKFVRMSSPYLNNLILLGGILVYSSVYFAGLDSTLVPENIERIACQVRVWVFSAGFVIAFGAMFGKTWRVHKVAAFKTPKRMIITDTQLFLMVFIMFVVDVTFLTVWQVIDPLKVSVRELLVRDDPDVPNQRLIPYVKLCTCDLLVYWLVPLYAYKGLLLVFGAFLAWEIRKVTIPALNDSKLIGISVYNVIILCVIGISVSFIISNDPSALYIFTSCIIIFCTSLTLLIVFVPKIVSVVKYPEGEPISTLKGPASTMNTIETTNRANTALEEENRQLKERLRSIESELGKMKENIYEDMTLNGLEGRDCRNNNTSITTSVTKSDANERDIVLEGIESGCQ